MHSNHQIVHKRAPHIWEEGLPIGNGEFGAMVWGDGNPLAFTLDRADLWDSRQDTGFMNQPDFNYTGLLRLADEKRWDQVDEVFEHRQARDNPIGPTKISIGRAEIVLEGVDGFRCALDIDRAMVEGVLTTSLGEHPITSFVSKSKNILSVRIGNAPREAQMRVVPLAEMSETLSQLNHPAPVISDDGDIRMLVQEIPEGPAYCLVWNPRGTEFFLAAESGETPDEAAQKAVNTWKSAFELGFDVLAASHTKEWSEFWSRSAVYLPEGDLELLWYYGVYLLASSAKKGCAPPGLQGLWAMDGVVPPWRGDYHADMNIQEAFWPACASGHLDLLDSWCDYMKACIEPAREFTRAFFGTEGAFWLCATVPNYTPVPGWHTVNLGWSHTGWLGWLVWLRWRYSMETEWLGETGYPVMADIFRFYRANVVEEDDGFLHVPLSSSPEYKANLPEAWCKDPNIDLALIRRCCDWIMEMEEALALSDLTVSAMDLRARLAPYSLTDRNELCLWPGKALDDSHLQPSHLMAIHPAMDMTIDDGAETRAIIEASVEQYLALGQYKWAGHTYAQLISFASVLGRPGWAYDCLSQYYERWIGANGLQFNRDLTNSGLSAFRTPDGSINGAPFTMEASNAVAAGISDMLVQGWNGVLRIFPAVPEKWRDVAFRDLRTEGAFQVSAFRRNGTTVWVKVRACVDGTLRLKDPFDGAEAVITGGESSRSGDSYVAPMKEAQELVFALSNETVNIEEAIKSVRNSSVSRLGLH